MLLPIQLIGVILQLLLPFNRIGVTFMIVVTLCLRVVLRLILLLELLISSYLVGLVVVILVRSLVLLVFHLMLVYVVLVDLDSLEHPRLTLVYYNLLMDYSQFLVAVRLTLELESLAMEHSLHSLVLLIQYPSIQKRSNYSSPLLDLVEVRNIQKYMLVLEDLETSLHLKQRKEHLIMKDLVV